MRTFADVVRSEEICREMEAMYKESGGVYPLFGRGNVRRDMVLLVRGDLKVETPVCHSFFGCVRCGVVNPKVYRVERKLGCRECEGMGTVYYFDGVGPSSRGRVEIGINDDRIKITKV